MIIDAKQTMHFKTLNEKIRSAESTEITIENCMGQRYIGSGLSKKTITINGTPGNALGAYLDGSAIEVNGNAQDATGDTMNEGEIVIHGNAGDATGYGMRGGKILVKGNSGYRSGIHMKAYKEKLPVLVVGNKAGSFLGEYQAGGLIIVLGLAAEVDEIPVGRFCGTGMHGGKIYIRTELLPADLPGQIAAKEATPQDLEEIEAYIDEFCKAFGTEKAQILGRQFYILSADAKNQYKQLYTHN